MSLNAWPSIQTAMHRGCILRLSNGYTNRANSANPLYSEKSDFTETADFAEGFYKTHGQSCVFKILQTERYDDLDTLLEKRHYEKISQTTVMKCDLSNFIDTDNDHVTIHGDFSDEWFDSFIAMNEIREPHVGTARQMLKLIPVDTIVCSVRIGSEIVACGYGAVENVHVGFFDIVVRSERRGQRLRQDADERNHTRSKKARGALRISASNG